MKALVCELCGSNEFVKEDGFFVCQHCHTKYSPEEAKKIMVEGTVDVSGSTVKVDDSRELENLYKVARQAKGDNDGESAIKYYEQIKVKDPDSWEAIFFSVYFRAMECKIAGITSAAVSIINCLETAIRLIDTSLQTDKEKIVACTEVYQYCDRAARLLFHAAKSHYDEIDPQLKNKYYEEYKERAGSSILIPKLLGDTIEKQFQNNELVMLVASGAWKSYVILNSEYNGGLPSTLGECSNAVQEVVPKIKKLEPDYEPPLGTRSSGCYVATAVYGSYDCPEVWTLRRFRDNTLAETWYGRAFIHTYYVISPTLVKWFGKTEWFKNLWKPMLDRLVQDLQNKGVENGPYQDKEC